MDENDFKQEYLGTFPEELTSTEIKTCRHCGLGKQYHLAELKCPFEASIFQAMSPEETLDTIKSIMKAWHRLSPEK